MQLKKNSLLLQFEGFLRTPPLWKSTQLLEIPQYVTKVVSAPEELGKEIHIPERLILGKRMESFFALYLKHFTNERILLKNQVISKDKISIGEIDYIVRNRESGEVTHIELIYKYYLYDPTIRNEIERWIGPNRKDTLVRKLERLRKHQFPLISSRECRDLLRDRLIFPGDILQKVCFKANLFLPMNWTDTPPLINPECIEGYWISWESFKESDFGTYDFFIPAKHNWPVDPSNCLEWTSFIEISSELQELHLKKRSPLVWMKKSSNKIEKFFVVWW